MGASESLLEYEFFQSKFDSVNPSKVEFELWYQIHSKFKEMDSIPPLFFNYISDEDAIKECAQLESSTQTYEELIKRLDEKTTTLMRVYDFSSSSIAMLIAVLTRSYQSSHFKKQWETDNKSKFKSIADMAINLVSEKVEAEKFPFDFTNYQASLLEVLKFLRFAHDFDNLILTQASIVNDFMHFKRIYAQIPESLRNNLRANPEVIGTLASFLSKDKPVCCEISKELSKNGSFQLDIFGKCLGRLAICASYTVMKNGFLEAADVIMILKSIVAILLIFDETEPNGAFDKNNLDKVPFLLCVQTIASFWNCEDILIRTDSIRLIQELKHRCQLNENSHEAVFQILHSIDDYN